MRRLLWRPWAALWRLVQRALFDGRAYTWLVPYGYRIHTPWFERGTPFAKAYRAAKSGGEMIVTPDRCYMLWQLARRASSLDGDVAECGVFRGGTAQLLAETIGGRPLHLFDSFEGMPDTVVPERDSFRPGDFGNTSLAAVQRRLARYDGIRFHPGFIPATFAGLEDVRWSFVHVDVDVYDSVRDCIAYFWPRLVAGGVLVFDDYGFLNLRHAARVAVDELFGHQAIVLPTGQALVIRPAGLSQAPG